MTPHQLISPTGEFGIFFELVAAAVVIMAFKRFEAAAGDVDPRVPTWNGAKGAEGLTEYKSEAQAYSFGLKDEDWKLAAPRLWSNLRGPSNRSTSRFQDAFAVLFSA